MVLGKPSNKKPFIQTILAERAIHLGSADATQLKTQAADASDEEADFLNAAIAAL